MPRRIVDLSIAIENDIPADPPGYELQIEYLNHKDTLPILTGRYAGLQESELPNGEAFALEKVRLSTHNGTHVDAPWHYASRMNDGTRTATIDEISASINDSQAVLSASPPPARFIQPTSLAIDMNSMLT